MWRGLSWFGVPCGVLGCFGHLQLDGLRESTLTAEGATLPKSISRFEFVFYFKLSTSWAAQHQLTTWRVGRADPCGERAEARRVLYPFHLVPAAGRPGPGGRRMEGRGPGRWAACQRFPCPALGWGGAPGADTACRAGKGSDCSGSWTMRCARPAVGAVCACAREGLSGCSGVGTLVKYGLGWES
jgi:hypothetical protein